MSSMRTVAAIAALLVAPFVAAQQASAPSTMATASAADGAPTVMAVWVEKKIFFPYAAFTAFYSCDGLRNKVHADDSGPLDPACGCPVCARWSRGYLRHLLSVAEPTAPFMTAMVSRSSPASVRKGPSSEVTSWSPNR